MSWQIVAGLNFSRVRFLLLVAGLNFSRVRFLLLVAGLIWKRSHVINIIPDYKAHLIISRTQYIFKGKIIK